MLLATIWPRVFTPAALYCTPCTPWIAVASSGVSVLALPWPMRTPPCMKLPALTMIMLVPADWICASIEVCAPVPSATIVMTAATPMIMPSIVSAVRILFRFSAFTATRRIIRNDIRLLYDATSAGCGSAASSSSAPPGHRLVGYHLTVAERDHPRAVFRDVRLVRNQHHGDSALFVQALEDAHHFDAGFRVEVSGRLVGQQNRRVVDQRARDRDALL